MNLIISVLVEIQDFSLLAFKAILNLFRRPRYIRETFEQMDLIGVGSLTIIILTGFFTGGVLALQTASTLRSFGAVGLTGQLVSMSLVRELGPVLSALMIAGRIGSGIASELGSMVVTDQINAMRALG
ncbi:MAG TPA: ABC transporter permease, partial [Acidobacteriota bacterium]|nr:ABC transporter permease [Acidobacteriota bacterium]